MATKMNMSVPYRTELIAVVIAIGGFMLIKDKAHDITVRLARIEADKAVVQQRKDLAKRWDDSLKNFNDSMQGFLLEDSATLKKVVRDTARSCGVVIDSLRVSQDNTGILGNGRIDASVSGEYSALVNFIQAVETANIRVLHLSIHGGAAKRQASVVLQGFFPKEAG